MSDARSETIKEFADAVNRRADAPERWLKSEESRSVEQKADDAEAVGHQSGQRIVELLRKHKADYTDDDLAHMQRVVSYVHRHLAPRPNDDIEHTAGATR